MTDHPEKHETAQPPAERKGEPSLMGRLAGQSPAEKVPANTAPEKPIQVRKQVVKKYGLMHALFRPLGVALALMLLVWGSVSIGMNFWAGYQRDQQYSQTRHIDQSAVEIFQRSFLAKDRVELIIRNYDGALERRLASNSQIKSYVKQRALELDAARRESEIELEAGLKDIFETAFDNRQKDIDGYADWFFEWKRPYIILKEAISSTTSRLIKLGEYESLRTAIERDMNDYFMDHYKEQVLKPEQRDEIITAGIEKLVRRAHEKYKATMAAQDEKMRAFIAANTTYLETVPADKPLTKTTLDWDAQRWKNPTYLMEDRAYDGIVGLGRVAAGGTLGALAIGPAVNRGLSSVFLPLARRFAASMGGRIALAEGGAVAGTAVEPVGGTIVGAAIGVVLGFAADYVANKLNEKFSRDKFITANQEALNSTITLWQEKLGANIQSAYDNWYNDAKAGLIIVRETPGNQEEPKKPEDMQLF